ncbi:Uncharacterised protein [Vibrio cholerae]|uniref:Uncharacterized protein n=1 Tax=Vibrio cholerae TaxID=666 RepID=A0A655US64_VIBCL|nr:Uncharacterised protein [Vibrio cholerae]
MPLTPTEFGVLFPNFSLIKKRAKSGHFGANIGKTPFCSFLDFYHF